MVELHITGGKADCAVHNAWMIAGLLLRVQCAGPGNRENGGGPVAPEILLGPEYALRYLQLRQYWQLFVEGSGQ